MVVNLENISQQVLQTRGALAMRFSFASIAKIMS